MGTQLFRKKALDSQFHPDNLDERMVLISPRYWMSLVALLLTLCLAGLWSWFGRIDSKVSGSGMIYVEGGFRNIVSQSGGIIKYLNVQEGEEVRTDEVLGMLSLPEQKMELEFLQNKLDLISQETEDILNLYQKNNAERDSFFKNIQSYNQENTRKTRKILDRLQHFSKLYTASHKKGLITELESFKILQEMVSTSINMAKMHQESLRNTIEKSDTDLNFKKEFWAKQLKLMESKYELQTKMSQYLAKSLIKSPCQGTIISVQKSPGDSLQTGEVVFLLSSKVSADLHVQAFIPASKSKNIQKGQIVHIAMSNIEPQRFGYMLGLVQEVDRYPATSEKLLTVFKNKELAEQLKQQEVAVIVKIALIPDLNNPTRIRWTGKAPDNVSITAGSLCQIFVVYEQRAPITYILPWIREKFLGESIPNIKKHQAG